MKEFTKKRILEFIKGTGIICYFEGHLLDSDNFCWRCLKKKKKK